MTIVVDPDIDVVLCRGCHWVVATIDDKAHTLEEISAAIAGHKCRNCGRRVTEPERLPKKWRSGHA